MTGSSTRGSRVVACAVAVCALAWVQQDLRAAEGPWWGLALLQAAAGLVVVLGLWRSAVPSRLSELAGGSPCSR